MNTISTIPEGRFPEIPSPVGVEFTAHARPRMAQGGVRERDVEAVLAFGRRFHWRRAIHYWVGRREVLHWGRRGIDLRDLERLHVVVREPMVVITVGRRSAHPRRHRRHRAGHPRRRRRGWAR